MNLKEAYSLLGIPEGTNANAAKKKYKELTKKYHPDINKEPGAEDKFKKINEAYQVVSTGKSSDSPSHAPQGNPFGGGGNPFGRKERQVRNIEIFETLTFKEAVLGCERDLKFKRETKCASCNGNGQTPENNGCTNCGGQGRKVTRNGNVVQIESCNRCYGRVSYSSCSDCDGHGVMDADTTIKVRVPGGISNGDVLRLGGVGNYAGSFGPLEQYMDAFLHLSVTPHPTLKIENQDVVFEAGVSLLNSLKGGLVTVDTIDGKTKVTVPPKTKNLQEVIIPNLGVNGVGSQRVIINVRYPENIDGLVSYLEETK